MSNMRRVSTKWKLIKEEFSLRNWGFRCKDEEKSLFYRSQWSDNRILFLIYHIVTASYVVGWSVSRLVKSQNPHLEFRYFAVWAELLIMMYFVMALFLSAVGVSRGNISNRMESGLIKFLRSATWMVFSISTNFQLFMAFIYWPLAGYFIAGTDADNLTDVFNIHLHLVAAILISMEIFMAAFPIRLPHFMYPSIAAAVYILMTGLLHENGMDIRYPFLNADAITFNNNSIQLTNYPLLLNWRHKPTHAATFALCIVTCGIFVTQLLIFSLHLLRGYITKCTRTRKGESSSPSDVTGNVANDFLDAISYQVYPANTERLQTIDPSPQDYF